jgi:hypothetical protein
VSANTASSTARIADTAAGSIVRYPGHYAVRLTFLSHASKLDVDVKRGSSQNLFSAIKAVQARLDFRLTARTDWLGERDDWQFAAAHGYAMLA